MITTADHSLRVAAAMRAAVDASAQNRQPFNILQPYPAYSPTDGSQIAAYEAEFRLDAYAAAAVGAQQFANASVVPNTQTGSPVQHPRPASENSHVKKKSRGARLLNV